MVQRRDEGQHLRWVGEIVVFLTPVWLLAIHVGVAATMFDRRLFRQRQGSGRHGQDGEEGKDDQGKLMHCGHRLGLTGKL